MSSSNRVWKELPNKQFLAAVSREDCLSCCLLWAEHGATWEIEPADEYWSQSVPTGLAFGKLPAFEFSPIRPSVGQLG